MTKVLKLSHCEPGIGQFPEPEVPMTNAGFSLVETDNSLTHGDTENISDHGFISEAEILSATTLRHIIQSRGSQECGTGLTAR